MSDLAVDNLPLEICREILLRLPAESLFRFRSVCKGWRTVIDDPSFARAHTFYHDQLPTSSQTLVVVEPSPSCRCRFCKNIHTFDLDTANFFTDDHAYQTISGSSLFLSCNESTSSFHQCNGLMLVHPNNQPKTRFEIWNPSTLERLQLPILDFFIHNGPVFTGLGYDRAAQDFKAVVMHSQQTHVYSLRSDTWTTKTTTGNICLDDDDDGRMWGHGVFLCGALHWLLKSEIVALDILGSENPLLHHIIHLNALQKKLRNKNIDVLGGCLVVSGHSEDFLFFEGWVIKDFGSESLSWTKLFSLKRVDPTSAKNERPVAYVKEKNQVFLKDGHGSGFILLDVESDDMKTVRISGLTGITQALFIPRTIFRLRDHCAGGSGTKRRMEQLCPPRKKMKMPLIITSS